VGAVVGATWGGGLTELGRAAGVVGGKAAVAKGTGLMGELAGERGVWRML